jgi:hypothetical protein
MRNLVSAASLAVVTLVAASSSSRAAVIVDGKLDADYGAPLVMQTTQTSAGDNSAGMVQFANGSELDAAYGFISDATLHLFLSGNLASRLVPADNPDNSDLIHILIDSVPGGQGMLIDELAGLQLDSGFAPDYAFRASNYDYLLIPGGQFITSETMLPTGGGGTWFYLGSSVPGGPGLLTGGSNPFGIQAAVDMSNVAGVTAGCGAGSGSGVTTGIEWSIPLAAIGSPAGCIAICALVTDYTTVSVSNQVLGPVPAGTCALGAASGVNFNAIPGQQFFYVCPAATPAQRSTWGQLKTRYH